MIAPAWTVLVVGMVGQMLDSKPFRFLDEWPFGSQRQLAPIVT